MKESNLLGYFVRVERYHYINRPSRPPITQEDGKFSPQFAKELEAPRVEKTLASGGFAISPTTGVSFVWSSRLDSNQQSPDLL